MSKSVSSDKYSLSKSILISEKPAKKHKNIHGTQFIDCFFAYLTNLSSAENRYPKAKFYKYEPERSLTICS